MKPKLAFIGSGNGSSFQRLYPTLQRASSVDIALVVTNRDCPFLHYARRAELNAILVPSKGRSRHEFELELNHYLMEHQIDLVVLVGFMRILSAAFANTWHQKIINVHPSLLPKHAGLMDLAVHQAVLDAGETQSGCTVHWVTEGVDEGPALLQKHCPVLPNDNAVTLKKRVQQLEADALLSAIYALTKEKCIHESISATAD